MKKKKNKIVPHNEIINTDNEINDIKNSDLFTVDEDKKYESQDDINKQETCKHVWECLRDRTHNKGNGKGKYQAYKCRECGKFQRRY